ncbi:MAG: pilus assembly protein PilM, partial [Bacillota bacterium]|nr:pilus assembly protein PilM [Bacillota bacterium]
VINDSYPLEEQTIAAIDLGHQFINVTVINKGLFEFSRLLNKGGKDIDTNMAHLLNLSLEEAEIKKREIKNINHDTEQDTSVTLVSIIEETILNWLDEIQKVFMYYTSRSTENVIDSICIYGGSSNIEGIPTYIQEFFNMPTFKIDNLSNVKFDNNLEEASMSSYVNAIGAIIRR